MAKHRNKQLQRMRQSVEIATRANKDCKMVIILGSVIFLTMIFPYLQVAFWDWFKNRECLIDMPQEGSKIFREIVDCTICVDVYNVPKLSKVSPDEFEERYVMRTKPAVVTDATQNWTAVNLFTFDYFKEVYANHSSADGGCQFFPYRTEFRSLGEALNMSVSRANLVPGEVPWYIGWSNCQDKAGRQLRQHYGRPYFLPRTSENIALSWIFMGGPGHGAHIHVDNVRYPSWQAQLRGRKRWHLVPPPECAFSCREIDIIVEPGEIIVVDTNVWYHQTFVLPGDISITIGAEFD